MMSKKQLACMLALHIVYLLVGASIFYHIESPVEVAQRAEEKLERLEIQNLLYENYIPNDPQKQDGILRKLSDYCGKSMYNYTTEDEEPPYKWDFYHSFFFSYTVVSTIGYGNLAPTTHLGRILMIFYGLFGIPINGILLANLGEYFGMQLISVYRKYKKRNEKRADKLDYFYNNLGMLGQIFLYLVPGFLFFIFLPACIFVVFEGTINNGFKYGFFLTYQIFLIVWITFGLGYIVMLLGFITSGMRSEKVHRLEQKFAYQLKSTQSKILQGFTRDVAVIRKIINEANLIKLKPVYVESKPHIHRSVSCPTFTYDVEPRGPIYKRKRANSENIQLSAKDMLRIQSDTDLLGIDKEKTFTASAIIKPAELLARVVNVLGGFQPPDSRQGINIFDDEHILASESPPFFSIGHDIIAPKRTRALSVAVPNYMKEPVPEYDHDYTWSNGDTAEKYRKEANIRSGKLSLPTSMPQATEDAQPKSLLERLFRKKSSSESPTEYIKSTMKGRGSSGQIPTDQSNEKVRRSSIFPTFGFGGEQKKEIDSSKERTSHRRFSIFPTFDFSEDEDTATVKEYQQRPKRHSIFPTFDFSADTNDDVKAYRERTRRGRHSIFPTFDFSDHNTSNDEETMDEDEISRYQNRTRRGRTSLFPTFGKSKKSDDDTLPESSDELVNYKEKTKHGRSSLLPTFGKSRKVSSPEESCSDLERSIKQYQNQTRRGRSSCFAGDATSFRNDDSAISNDIENYINRTHRGRKSLFDPDVNISTLPESEQVEVLENTSVADLLRALAVLETANAQTMDDSPNYGGTSVRRGSLRPDLPTIPSHMDDQMGPRRRRVSARLAAPQFTPTLATVVAGAELQITAASQRENRMTMLSQPPPPYTESEDYKPRVRRYSPAPMPASSEARSAAPVARLFSRSRKDSSQEDTSRRSSLTDIVIDNNKDKT
ncbi:unnamed protein product [Leptidea sinapis]|uniref:Potassium channel domain-containing protein n=1 Tax=Leptidea sinapis TaxID=189913 RepID=A0A5E4QP13_9NEOP|nr:unnamed protein product [Leptidea sinapis]